MPQSFYFFTTQSPSSTIGDFIKTYGSLIGNGITILLFYLAYESNKRKELSQKRKVKSDKLKYFASLINSSIKLADSNKQHIVNFSRQFIDNPTAFYILKKDSYHDIKRIVEKLNLEEYFLAYSTHFANDKIVIAKFQKITSSIDSIYEILNEVSNDIIRASQNHDERIRKINKVLDDISPMFDAVYIVNDKPGFPIPLKEGMIKIYANWREETTEKNFDRYIEIFCNPLLALIDSLVQDDRSLITNQLELLENILLRLRTEYEYIRACNINFGECKLNCVKIFHHRVM